MLNQINAHFFPFFWSIWNLFWYKVWNMYPNLSFSRWLSNCSNTICCLFHHFLTDLQYHFYYILKYNISGCYIWFCWLIHCPILYYFGYVSSWHACFLMWLILSLSFLVFRMFLVIVALLLQIKFIVSLLRTFLAFVSKSH